MLDFEGVLAATAGFLDGLIGALAGRDAGVGLTGMTARGERLAARIVERRELGSRFRLILAASGARPSGGQGIQPTGI